MTIVTAEDLVNELKKLIQTHGNLEVVNADNDYVTVEFNDDEGNNEAFVIS